MHVTQYVWWTYLGMRWSSFPFIFRDYRIIHLPKYPSVIYFKSRKMLCVLHAIPRIFAITIELCGNVTLIFWHQILWGDNDFLQKYVLVVSHCAVCWFCVCFIQICEDMSNAVEMGNEPVVTWYLDICRSEWFSQRYSDDKAKHWPSHCSFPLSATKPTSYKNYRSKL